MDRVREVFCAVMKIADACGARLPIEGADVRQLILADLELTYITDYPFPDVSVVQIRRGAEQLAALAYLAKFDRFQPFQSFSLAEGPWQDMLIAEARGLPTQHLDS